MENKMNDFLNNVDSNVKDLECLNCGNIQNEQQTETYVDSHGRFATCINCESSFDVE